jgi:6-methylsalicylate decarboxylase
MAAPIIDVHAHYFPPAFTEAYEKLSGGRKAWPQHAVELDGRVAALAAAGVDRQAIGLGHNQPYFKDAEAALACARLANDTYAKAIAPHGGRLVAFGAIPLPHTQLAIDEAARCLDELGFAGIGVGTSVAGRTLDDPAFEPIWAALDKRKTVVFVHPVGTPDTFIPGADGFAMGPKLGGPHEAGVATLRLVLSGVTTRHSGIRFIVAPMGGTLPFLWPRFEEMSAAQLKSGAIRFNLEGDPVDALRGLYYDTTLTNTATAFNVTSQLVGIGQIVLGTDAPRVPVADWIAAMRAIPAIGHQDPHGVLGRTAHEKLGL